MNTLRLTVLLSVLALFTAGPAFAVSFVDYSMDVEITKGTQFGLVAGDILLDAGQFTVDETSISGVGVETASVVDFRLVLGTEVFDFQPTGTIQNVTGWGSYANENLVTYTDGEITVVSLASVSQNGHILELSGRWASGTIGQLSLMADNYYVGEVRGTYSVNSVPEPTAGLLYAIGTALTLGVLRRR